MRTERSLTLLKKLSAFVFFILICCTTAYGQIEIVDPPGGGGGGNAPAKPTILFNPNSTTISSPTSFNFSILGENCTTSGSDFIVYEWHIGGSTINGKCVNNRTISTTTTIYVYAIRNDDPTLKTKSNNVYINYVSNAPTPSVDRTSVSLCGASPANFNVTSSSSGTYKWYRSNNTPVGSNIGSDAYVLSSNPRRLYTNVSSTTSFYVRNETPGLIPSNKRNVTVIVNPIPGKPVITPSNPPAGTGTTAFNLSATASNATISQYKWYNANTNVHLASGSNTTFTVTEGNTLSVKVKATSNHGCESTFSNTVNLVAYPPIPAPEPPIAFASPQIICEPELGPFTTVYFTVNESTDPNSGGGVVNPEGEFISDYYWYESVSATSPIGNGISISRSLNASTTLYVEAEGDGGSSGRTPVTVQFITSTHTTGNLTTYFSDDGDQHITGAPAPGGTWSMTEGPTNALLLDGNFTLINIGSLQLNQEYELIYTYTENGCVENTFKKYIRVVPGQSDHNILISGDGLVCRNGPGETIRINPTRPEETYFITKDNGGNTEQITSNSLGEGIQFGPYNEAGRYEVYVNTSSPVFIGGKTISEYPELTNQPDAGGPLCAFKSDDAFELFGSPSWGNWRLNGTEVNEIDPANINTGTHTLTYIIKDPYNCNWIDTTLLYAFENVSFVSDQLNSGTHYLEVNESVNLTLNESYDEYRWQKDGVFVSNSSTYSASEPGLYEVVITKDIENGGKCRNQTSVFINKEAIHQINTKYVRLSGVKSINAAFGINRKDSATTSNSYVDGRGRPIQSVIQEHSPQGYDVLQATFYDEFGRTPMQYLPYTSPDQSGNFKEDFKNEQSSFYINTTEVASSTKPFSNILYDNSPLNRIKEQYAPGEAWQDHPIEFDYLTNEEDEVILFEINDSGSLEENNHYEAGELYLTVTTDEHGNQAKEYKDKEGRIVLKAVQSGAAEYAKTYYVYDDFGQLAVVLPPEAVKQIEQP
ncbi:MAG: DUF6443 domain-containing protein [Bacteroidota bacterium]